MTKLQELHRHVGQSPWLDNLRRSAIISGELRQMVADGIRGVTSNPAIFQKSVAEGALYDEQLADLTRERPVEEAYWELAIDDVTNALAILRPLYDETKAGVSGPNAVTDGFVSIEVAASLAHDADGTIEAARSFHERIAEPNLLVKIPATGEGVPAVRQMIAEGRSINITLIFSLPRYEEIIEAYLSGLEEYDGDLSGVHSVASFFVSRVDTEVDRRLEEIGSDDALALRGQAAVAQAKLAYRLFRERFSGPRWEALAARGAMPQRPLWASTSTKNPTYPDLLYVETLEGPDTVNTLPEPTIAAFEDHGTVAPTIEAGVEEAEDVLLRLALLGIDMDEVGAALERQGVALFQTAHDEVIRALEDKVAALRGAA